MSNKEDFYQMLGLQNLRFRATQSDIKKAYRQCVLKYHPDKMAQNDNVHPPSIQFEYVRANARTRTHKRTHKHAHAHTHSHANTHTQPHPHTHTHP